MKILRASKDPYFKRIRELRTREGRKLEQRFLIEDEGLLQQALDARFPLESVLVGAHAREEDTRSWLDPLPSEVGRYALSEGLLHKLFPTGRRPRVVAVAKIRQQDIATLTGRQRCLVLEDIQDAGNLGTLLRTAEGLGYSDVVMLESSVSDLYNRICVRASMGSLFRVRLYHAPLGALRARLDREGMKLLCTAPAADADLQNVQRSGSLAVALGNETRGCSASLLEAADLHVRIQMRGQVESLNVAVCAGAVLHHLGGEPDGG